MIFFSNSILSVNQCYQFLDMVGRHWSRWENLSTITNYSNYIMNLIFHFLFLCTLTSCSQWLCHKTSWKFDCCRETLTAMRKPFWFNQIFRNYFSSKHFHNINFVFVILPDVWFASIQLHRNHNVRYLLLALYYINTCR